MTPSHLFLVYLLPYDECYCCFSVNFSGRHARHVGFYYMIIFEKKGLSEKGYERSPLRVGKGTRYRKQHNNVLEKRLLHLIAAEPRNVLAYYKPYYLENSIKQIT